MIKMIIWRHGRTRWNAEGRVQGQADVDLDDVGQRQVASAANRLADLRPDLIVSSDLVRAVCTARALATLTELPVYLDPRLRERDFGPWQGLTQVEIRERHPDDHARWREGTPIANPAIETVAELAKRVGAALCDVAARVDSGVAVVVTHGGAARAGCARLLGWPIGVWSTLAVLDNGRFTELRRAERGWFLFRHNVA